MSVFRAMSCRAVSIQTVAMGTTTMQGRRKEKKNNPAGEDEEHKKVEKKIEKRERERKLVVIRKADVRLTHCNLGNKMEKGAVFSPPPSGVEEKKI